MHYSYIAHIFLRSRAILSKHMINTAHISLLTHIMHVTMLAFKPLRAVNLHVSCTIINAVLTYVKTILTLLVISTYAQDFQTSFNALHEYAQIS